MMRLLRSTCQKCLSVLPAVIQRPALEGLSFVARRSSDRIGNHFHAFASGIAWKPFEIRPKHVAIGDCQAVITPHVGEFDFATCFLRRFEHEIGLVDWVHTNAPKYDLIIEMGANVGVFSILLGSVCKKSKTRIVSLEPSRAAFARLYANVKQSQVDNVTILNAAAGESTGLCEFFEPSGHLTNGSLVANFASIFSDDVQKNHVIALGPEFFEQLAADSNKILIKMDVEGFEPKLLRILSGFVMQHRPDIVLEVLSETESEIREVIKDLGFQRLFLISDQGLESHSELFASNTGRDWLLTF